MNKKGERWTLTLNSSGKVNMDEVNLRDSELITHGGSLNGKNVNAVVVSLGNLSPSWGPFDPVPVINPNEPSETNQDESISLAGDANDDGVVNLADFSILASVFGTTDSTADFNDDGVVNLADFSILAANFGKSVVVAAPAAKTSFSHSASPFVLHVPSKLHRGDVVEVSVIAKGVPLKAYSFVLGYDTRMLRLMEEGISEGDFLKDAFFMAREDGRIFSATFANASEGTAGGDARSSVLTKLRFQVVADGVSEDAIALRDVQIVDGDGRFSHLPELHAKLSTVPHKTRLLANYPNPFNPETWIPFALAEDAKVNIQIYDVSGRLVRTLDLGRVPAGFYVDRSSAAYWDGRNNTGESVASGLYLYRLSAGYFSAMRRIVILK